MHKIIYPKNIEAQTIESSVQKSISTIQNADLSKSSNEIGVYFSNLILTLFDKNTDKFTDSAKGLAHFLEKTASIITKDKSKLHALLGKRHELSIEEKKNNRNTHNHKSTIILLYDMQTLENILKKEEFQQLIADIKNDLAQKGETTFIKKNHL